MKINKIEKSNEVLTVFVDEIEDMGFNFNIQDIQGKQDLKKKVKEKVWEELARRNNEKDFVDRFEKLKELENKEI